MPRHNFFNNFIKEHGYELTKEKGFSCVEFNRCNTSYNSIQYYTNGNPYFDINFQTDWVKAKEHLLPDYIQISSSSVVYDPIIISSSSTLAKTFPTLFGFVGGDKIKMDLNTSFSDINGSYYSTTENKTYSLKGRINPQVDNSTGFYGANISMNEFENGSISGRFDINSDRPQNVNGGNNYNLSMDVLGSNPENVKKLFGTYSAYDGIQYDLYLTPDTNEIDNWKTETFNGKLYNNNSNWQSVFIKIGDKFYHSKNVNKFKDIPNESEVTFIAKTRPSYQGDYYSDRKANCYEGGCGQPGFNSRDLLFGISDVKIVDQSKAKLSISQSSLVSSN